MAGDREDAPVLLMTGKVFGGGVDTAIAEAPRKAQPRLGPRTAGRVHPAASNVREHPAVTSLPARSKLRTDEFG